MLRFGIEGSASYTIPLESPSNIVNYLVSCLSSHCHITLVGVPYMPLTTGMQFKHTFERKTCSELAHSQALRVLCTYI